MITLGNINNFNRTLSFFGLSSDTKPTGTFVQDEVSRYSVTNGSTFVEIDTGDEYMFNDANDTWVKIEGGGASTEEITEIVTQQVEQMQIHEGQTVIDATLSVQGAAADAKKTGDELTNLLSAFEEFPEGTYPDMTVGGVMSVDGGTEDQVPYIFRTSGGGLEIGNREIDEIVGGTVAWNQLAGNGATPGTTERNGLTFTINADGSVDVSGTATATTNFNVGTAVGGHANHKRLIIGCPPGGSAYTYNLKDGYGAVRDTGNGTIDAVSLDSSIAQISIASGTAISGTLKFKPQIFDLTQMFGTTIADYIYALETATAGAGVAWFKRLFPNDYYAYDAGSLKSVEGVSAHVMRGFNQWDEEWEQGSIHTNTGVDITNPFTIRNKHAIPVLPNTDYYFRIDTTSNTIAYYYRSDLSFISASGARQNNVFRTPSNCAWLRFVSNETANKGICINLSDPDRNGTYEPYDGHTYALDSSLTLRGIPKLDSANRLYYDGDTYASNGTVTRRYGVVDLGTLDWNFDATYSDFSVNTWEGLYRPTVAEIPSAITVGYQPIVYNRNTALDKVFMIGRIGINFVRFKDSAYTDAATFKAAMSGVMLVYELATPTTETADPYTNPQIVGNLGTEEYVTTGIVPVGHYTKYPTDIVAKVDGLPSDFSTLIATTEKGFTASKAYAVNNFLIVSNQLYRVTATIASGATITPGTNVTAVTVADILTQLLNA